MENRFRTFRISAIASACVLAFALPTQFAHADTTCLFKDGAFKCTATCEDPNAPNADEQGSYIAEYSVVPDETYFYSLTIDYLGFQQKGSGGHVELPSDSIWTFQRDNMCSARTYDENGIPLPGGLNVYPQPCPLDSIISGNASGIYGNQGSILFMPMIRTPNKRCSIPLAPYIFTPFMSGPKVALFGDSIVAKFSDSAARRQALASLVSENTNQHWQIDGFAAGGATYRTSYVHEGQKSAYSTAENGKWVDQDWIDESNPAIPDVPVEGSNVLDELRGFLSNHPKAVVVEYGTNDANTLIDLMIRTQLNFGINVESTCYPDGTLTGPLADCGKLYGRLQATKDAIESIYDEAAANGVQCVIYMTISEYRHFPMGLLFSDTAKLQNVFLREFINGVDGNGNRIHPRAKLLDWAALSATHHRLNPDGSANNDAGTYWYPGDDQTGIEDVHPNDTGTAAMIGLITQSLDECQ